jgi:exodeoxyribonuclease V alpha subunit
MPYRTFAQMVRGSECPVVVIPMSTQHYTMLVQHLVYTGVTRGKQLVILVGQRKALAITTRNGGARRRWSKLSEWLGSNVVGEVRPTPRRASPGT